MLNLASQASLKLGRLAPEHRALFAEQGRKDFWFFLTGILGLNLREEPHKKMAEEFQEFTESGNPYALWLWPRETYKSTVFTQGGVLWRLVRNPEERVLITNAKLDNAMGFLRWIKDQIEGHEFFRWVYGDLTTKRWYTERVWIKGYNPQAKEPSIEIASVDSSVVSKHYTLIVADDLVNEAGVGTDDRVRYTITYFERLQPLLTWQGQMFFVGTRWAHWDLYQYLIDNFKDDPEWWISVRGIKETDSEGNVYSIFPDPEIGFPMERIARMEKTMPTEFWTHYMNQPKVDDTVRLPFDEDEHVFEELPPGVKGLRFITCDPATSQSSRADESAIVVTLQTPDDRLYVLDVRHGRWSPSQFCEELFALYRKWYPVRAVGIETSVAAQRLWLDLIQHEERRRETKLPIKELKTGVQKDAKHARILELEPYIMEGKYKVHVSCRGLIDQLVAYPGLSHDDILDAAAYIMQVKRPRPWTNDNRWAGARTYRPRTKAGI